MRKLLYLLLPAVMALIPYHPKKIINIKLDLSPGQTRNINVEAQQIIMEYSLHKDTELCMSGNMTALLAIHVMSLEHRDKVADLLYLHPNEIIQFHRFFGPNWELVTMRGLNLTFRAMHNTTNGTIQIFRCVKETYVAFNDEPESTTLKPLVVWDSTIHIPFIVSYDNPYSTYVDFSMILPKLRYFYGYDEHGSSFCLNATIRGPVDIFVKRCKNDLPVKYSVPSAHRRHLVQGWSSGLNLFNKCPLGEETLPDHLHVQISSTKHVGIGEIIAYNCHNQWLSGKNDDDVRIFPTLNFPEDFQWKLPYSVGPFRLHTYFVPIKHMLDTVFVLEGQLLVVFGGLYPQTVSFSACYKSPRTLYNITGSKTIIISRASLRMMSLQAGELNCAEEKTYGLYIHIGTGETSANGTVYLKYDKKDLVYTPNGPRMEQDLSAVAFNLKKGQEISCNVNWQNLIEQATFNKHMELHMNINASGLVVLSVSRCAYTPRLKLFPPMAKGAFQFNEKEIEYLNALDLDMSCSSDQNPFRIDYRPKPNFGLTLHVKALEDTFGYVVPYEFLRAELKYRQINEDYNMSKPKEIFQVSEERQITNSTPIILPMDLLHLVIRTQQAPPATLRLYMKCSEQCRFGLTRCIKEEVSEWKDVEPLKGKDYVWYTFDDEGVDFLKALLESTNCVRKREPHLYVHIQSDKPCTVAISFEVFKGRDENPIEESTFPFKTVAAIGLAILVVFLGTMLVIYLHRRRAADFEDMEGEEVEMEMADR